MRETAMNEETRRVDSDLQSDDDHAVKTTSAPTYANAERRWSDRIQSFRLTAADAIAPGPIVQGMARTDSLPCVRRPGTMNRWVMTRRPT